MCFLARGRAQCINGWGRHVSQGFSRNPTQRRFLRTWRAVDGAIQDGVLATDGGGAAAPAMNSWPCDGDAAIACDADEQGGR